MSKRDRREPPSEPSVDAVAVRAHGIGTWEAVYLRLPPEIVERYAICRDAPEVIPVVGLRLNNWAIDLTRTQGGGW